MMTVTFCGHSLVAKPKEVEAWLRETVEDLIKQGATQFYLGGYGDFDSMAFQAVEKFKKEYPYIKAIYVMAYLDRVPFNVNGYDGTTYPPIEEGPPRFAISRRNKWMAEVSDVVVAYLRHEDIGGATAMYRHAKRMNKPIIRYEQPTKPEPGMGHKGAV